MQASKIDMQKLKSKTVKIDIDNITMKNSSDGG